MKPFRIASALVISTLALFAASPGAYAQAYPSKPVRFIFPYAPGGSTEILARLIGTKLQASLGQPFLVESKPGAGGNVGTDQVAKAAPDGYTILLGASGPLAINVTLYDKLPYDPTVDLVPVVHAASIPLVLIANPGFAPKTVKELIAALKARPDGMPYASAGTGTPQHLSMELLKITANVPGTHVPYKGSSLSVTDLLSGQIQLVFENLPTVLTQIKANRLRPLAVGTRARSSLVPDVPTMVEAGVPGYEASTAFGVLVPAKTPRDRVNRLNHEIAIILKTQDVKDRLAGQGMEAVGGSSEQYSQHLTEESAKYARVIKAANVKLDQ